MKSLDLISALLLHIMVFTVIGVLMYWQQQHRPSEPLKRIEVMMISAKELAKLEQQARNRPKPVKHAKPEKPEPKPEIVQPSKAKPSTKKPVIKPRPAAKKPAIKPKPKPKPPVKKTVSKPRPPVEKPVTKAKPVKKAHARAKPDENFDPFAPLASSTDKKVSKKASTSRPELADLVGKQLSTSEKERYIGLMQAAVQQHWKVPVSTANFTDPLVEMTLLRNGDVASIKILESSGNDVLDASLIRAIKAAAPFQLPRRQFEFFRVNRLRFHPLK
ncbi:MAG: TonB family protein [Mariprofundus sp.]|nr:TonB family protein [Mariprofundus sp.]